MKEQEKKRTIRQAIREILAGYDVLDNLKFLAIAFLGFLGFKTR